ncbi:hypothetical protein [Bosea sp. (in: a-proteobacteria)]|uniref:hypothetical protein n=1 Tax=Bosea sp. (in: a-proteobacteria) TaxID=1871050 RepID=UPI002DDCC8B8|nr:hypothetical protein [Bosea sp. (in: a-proteobacteria)]
MKILVAVCLTVLVTSVPLASAQTQDLNIEIIDPNKSIVEVLKTRSGCSFVIPEVKIYIACPNSVPPGLEKTVRSWKPQ